MKERYIEWEKKCSRYLKTRSITCLRLSMAIIYFWFGLLKIFGDTPPSLETIIFHASKWMEIPYFIQILGILETIIGILLFFKKSQRWGVLLLFLQMIGTFLPLFVSPQEYFPSLFELTFEAQYILKNIVYVAAGLVLIGSLHEKPTSKLKP